MVNWDLQGRIAVVQIDNPPVNSITMELLQDFVQCLDQMEKEEKINVMIVTSAQDKVFATSPMGGKKDSEQITIFNKLDELLKRITLLSYPTISIVSGSAIDAGFELALACDFRIVSVNSKLRFSDNYKLTDIGMSALIDIVGHAKVKELIWLGQTIGGEQAAQMGIVSRAVPASQLMSEGWGMAYSIVAKSKNMFHQGKHAWRKFILNV